MPLAVSVRIGFIDSKSKTSFTKIRIPNGFSIAQYQEFAQGAAQTLATFSNCQVTSASVCIGLDLSGATLKAAAQVTADIAQKGQFIFNSAVAGFKKIFRIPTFSEAFVVPNSDSLDESDTDVAVLVYMMENGLVTPGGTIEPVDSRANDLVSLSSTRELFRKT